MTRRTFAVRAGKTVAIAATTAPMLARVSAEPTPDKVRIGLVGCGARGTGAAMDAVLSSPNSEIAALADLFPDKVEKTLQRLRSPQKGVVRDFASQYGSLTLDWNRFDAVNVHPDHCFTGFDACAQLLQTDVDIVILAEPPGFRPLHIREALNAGKHVFAEKPVSVDPAGTRSVLESTELAVQKKLGLMGGTQLRFSQPYNDIIKRVHDGQIGQIASAECYWWHDFFVRAKAFPRDPKWSDMEYQIRCWPHFVWLSGDHIVENLVHNIDVINWVMGGPPKSAAALGGHSNWEDWDVKGNIYDHFYVEYVYPNGATAHASSRQTLNCAHRLGERIMGTKGNADPYARIVGENAYEYRGPFDNPRFIQWRAFLDSIRKGAPLNTGKQVAEASMTAILGRMSAYTGRSINYEWALTRSQLDLFPKKLELGPLPVEPLAVPGRTPLI